MGSIRKIFIVCTGLGRINRGFETFARECFGVLQNADESLEFMLFKGGGDRLPGQNEYVCRNLPRQLTTRLMGPSKAYRLENMTFVLSLLPRLIRDKPSVIMVSDFFAACYLMHLKWRFGFTYKVLFSNGGPSGPPYIFDHVHQLTHVHFREAMAYGEPPAKHTVLPYGFITDETLPLLSVDERNSLKRRLGIPTDKTVILSVGAVNTSHKRMNYLIDEVAPLTETFLIILGQFEHETSAVLTQAEQKLPDRVMIKTVDERAIGAYYACADVFVLASLREGFGRSYIEALNAGLPVCANDYPITRELLQQYGYYADFTKQGALNTLIRNVLQLPLTDRVRQKRHAFVNANFSWQTLKNQYLIMIKQLCSAPELIVHGQS